MPEVLKDVTNHEIEEIVGTISGMCDMSHEQEQFLKDELMEFADFIAKLVTEVKRDE